MAKIRIGINGYGVIGKRIADAVRLQDDMELVGVTARTVDYRLLAAIKRGIPIFGSNGDACTNLMNSRIDCKGDISALVKRVDVIIDATPKGIGEKNKELYDLHGIKSIFQGGEKHELTNFSFVAQINYKEALGKQSIRVVSCNTTAICRVLQKFTEQSILEKAYIALARRGSDPVDSHQEGPLGTVVLEPKIPSHQGEDAKFVIPGLNVLTSAISVPTTLGHLHMAFLRLNKEISKEEIVKLLYSAPRLATMKHSDGLVAQNQVVELMRDLGRARADMWEVAWWEDSLYVDKQDVAFYYQVHNEAIVIPENIDAIRAVMGSIQNPEESIQKTNQSLGVLTNFTRS